MPSIVNTATAGTSISSPSKTELKRTARWLDISSFFRGQAAPTQRRPDSNATRDEYRQFLAQAPQCPAVLIQLLRDGHITKDAYFAGFKAHCDRLADRRARAQELDEQARQEEARLAELREECGWTEEEFEVKRVCSQGRLDMKLMEEYPLRTL
ncbi:hypothetical protein EWM64_g3475 [Hericium alpestre]|uniref:Uncharacterized protein n=1 Tax=Hericium alpestre TaxID=135208 RepID=A0A4Z0A2V3_9AGAM|nr:hypothetical protein EWM64_g3475 [Hericium alpestre]